MTRWVIRNFETNGAVEALLNAASTTVATLASCVAPGGDRGAEERLGGGVVARRHRDHRARIIAGIAVGDRRAADPGIGPAGQRAGDAADILRCVIGLARAGAVELRRTIHVELVGAHREELEQFAGVILRRRRLVAVGHVEIVAHISEHRHAGENVAEIAEGIVEEDLVERGDARGRIHFGFGRDDHLAEREGDALAELIGRHHGIGVEAHRNWRAREMLARADGVAAGAEIAADFGGEVGIGAAAGGELLVEPAVHAELLDPRDQSRRRTEARLFGEARGIAFGEGRRGRGSGRNRDQAAARRRACAAAATAVAARKGNEKRYAERSRYACSEHRMIPRRYAHAACTLMHRKQRLARQHVEIPKEILVVASSLRGRHAGCGCAGLILTRFHVRRKFLS